MSAKYIIVGAGDFGRELAEYIKQALHFEPVFIDDEKKNAMWSCDSYKHSLRNHVHMGIAAPTGKRIVYEKLRKKDVEFYSFMAHNCTFAGSAGTGVGCIICPYSLISVNAQLGDMVTVNSFCSIGHDVKIGSFTTLSSHVDLCGHVVVGKEVFFGSGARVLPNIKIGDGAFIGAGAVVLRDIRPGEYVFGNPARSI